MPANCVCVCDAPCLLSDLFVLCLVWPAPEGHAPTLHSGCNAAQVVTRSPLPLCSLACKWRCPMSLCDSNQVLFSACLTSLGAVGAVALLRSGCATPYHHQRGSQLRLNIQSRLCAVVRGCFAQATDKGIAQQLRQRSHTYICATQWPH